MKLSTMAIRNLGRNKRRTLLTALSVFIAMTMVMFLDGMVGGLMGNLIKNYTKNDVGHVSVTTQEYRRRERFMPVSEYIRGADEVAAAIRAAPGLEGRVTAVAERIRFGVLLSSGAKTKSALCFAGDAEAEKGLLMLDRSVREGAYLSKPGEALIGKGIAKDLGLGVGDSLKVVTQKADYGLGFKRFRVVGVFATNVNSLDGKLFQIGLEDARELLGAAGGATQMIALFDRYETAGKNAVVIANELEKAGFAGLSVVPWTKSGSYAQLMLMMGKIYAWIDVIIAFLGAFIIANVMMMVVLERRKEIGILKAMGMPRREILWLFLLEGAMLGAIGSILGVAAGMGLNTLLHFVGLDFSGAMASISWPMDNIVYNEVNPPSAVALFLLGVFVSTVIAFLPARKAATMDPIEAIRSA
jgi:putative ABC transport system permease protein